MGKCIIMDKRKIANQLVKDRLFSALVDFAGEKDWSKVSLEYHEKMPALTESPHSREMILYKFRFYREHADLVLAFHHAKISTTLLDVITDCEIDAYGDMPANSIAKYELYYFAGAFYNMLLCWLEGGMRETPEAMTDEFLRIAGSFSQRQGAPENL